VRLAESLSDEEGAEGSDSTGLQGTPRAIGAGPNWGPEMAVCQNLVPLVNIKIAGKWMFIPLKMVLIGIDPYPNQDEKNGDWIKP